ncbi:MAG TPA: HAD-IA family hydrolase [Novosphingobium sp.]|nr:HAD-IA family hydrolase [Novosphingobium sp.]
MTRLAVFDCDGTLVDGQADICAAMDHAFAAHGLAAPPGPATRRIVGLSLPEAMRRLHPQGAEADHTHLCNHFKAAFQARRAEGRVAEPLYEGIAALLDTLRADGWLLGVATGKSDRGLTHCLATHGLADHFVTLQTADRHPSKPHPAMLEAAMAATGVSPADCAMIGDTAYDMAMGKAAGTRAIGVAWGYHAASELAAAGAEAVAASPAELGAILKGLP